MTIRKEIRERVLRDIPLINKIAVAVSSEDCPNCNKDTQAIKRWLKEDNLMLRLTPVIFTIQNEYNLSDKQMFESTNLKRNKKLTT